MRYAKQRIAELAVIGKHREFTDVEAQEWEESRQLLTNQAWKEARIFNLMRAARIGKDWVWFNELEVDFKRLMRGL